MDEGPRGRSRPCCTSPRSTQGHRSPKSPFPWSSQPGKGSATTFHEGAHQARTGVIACEYGFSPVLRDLCPTRALTAPDSCVPRLHAWGGRR